MFIQLFRNKIYENRTLKVRIRKIDDFVSSIFHEAEPNIVKELAYEWTSRGPIDLGSFQIAGAEFDLLVDFRVKATHGAPFVNVADVSLSSGNNISYETEFGDLALLVSYVLDGELGSKLSILQTKKEKAPDQVTIPLSQQYLMQFWPDLKFRGTSGAYSHFHFSGIRPDEFAFYHFILNNHANPTYSSSLCSAPLVGEVWGVDRNTIEACLVKWDTNRLTNSKIPAPSMTLSQLSLEPGGVYRHGASYEWNLIPKPLTQFILDAANLNVGTDNAAIIDLANARIKTILALNVVGGRRNRDRKERRGQDFDEERRYEQ